MKNVCLLVFLYRSTGCSITRYLYFSCRLKERNWELFFLVCCVLCNNLVEVGLRTFVPSTFPVSRSNLYVCLFQISYRTYQNVNATHHSKAFWVVYLLKELLARWEREIRWTVVQLTRLVYCKSSSPRIAAREKGKQKVPKMKMVRRVFDSIEVMMIVALGCSPGKKILVDTLRERVQGGDRNHSSSQ